MQKYSSVIIYVMWWEIFFFISRANTCYKSSVGRIQANAKDYGKDSPQKRRLGTRQENVLFIHSWRYNVTKKHMINSTSAFPSLTFRLHLWQQLKYCSGSSFFTGRARGTREGERLFSFFSLARPRDFFLRPKNPAPATKAKIVEQDELTLRRDTISSAVTKRES